MLIDPVDVSNFLFDQEALRIRPAFIMKQNILLKNLKELRWIESSMDNLKIDTLILFLSICPSLEKLFINVKILCSLFSIPAYCGLLNFFCSFIPRLIVYISLLSTKLIPVNDFQMDATNYDTPVETIPAIYRDALTNKVKNTCLNNLRVIKFENFTNEHDEFKLTKRLQKVASVGAIFLTTPNGE